MAFINILTGAIILGVESSRAGTVAHTASNGHTFSSLGAISLVLAARQDTVAVHEGVRGLTSTVSTVALCTLLEGISVVAWWALTVIAAGQILAESIETTDRLLGGSQGTLIDVSAQS